MDRQFKYDAFISYRHTDLDKFVAENIHKQLENFRLPGNVARKHKGEKSKIERVFRDKEELPLATNLADPIIEALQSSEWLIVICTPRLKESEWCKKEIETFIQLRDRDHVLLVLAEGEPNESFPEELLYRVDYYYMPDGSMQQMTVPVEPLAADMRGTDKKQVLKAIKSEKIRLLAAMFGLTYDELRQRHRERKMRRVIAITLVGAAICLLFGVYSTATALKIQKQNEQIEAQSAEIQTQADSIKQQSEEIAKQNSELLCRQARSLAAVAETYMEEGNRVDAIKTSLEALTVSDGIEMPYTPEAHMALADSVRIYDPGQAYKADYQYEMAGKIDELILSPDKDTLLIEDELGNVVLFNPETREVIKEFVGEEEISKYTFLGNDFFVYLLTSNKQYEQAKYSVFDLNTREIVNEFETEGSFDIYSTNNGKYIIAENLEGILEIYDGQSLERIGTTSGITGSIDVEGKYLFDDGIMTYVEVIETAMENETEVTYILHFLDLNTGKDISSMELGNKQLEELRISNGVAYGVFYVNTAFTPSYDSYVMAIDIAKGEIIWEQEFIRCVINTIELPGNEAHENLFVGATSNVFLINKNSGEVAQTVAIPSTALVVKRFADYNDFLLLCRNGETVRIQTGYANAYDCSYIFECKTQNNSHILTTEYGVVVLENMEHKITVYTMQASEDMIVIDEIIDETFEADEFSSDEKKGIVEGYNLEKPEYVKNVFYSDDDKYCFIQYWDGKVIVYDVEAGNVCNTFNAGTSITHYDCVDSDGNVYIMCMGGYYVLNKDMAPIMWIQDAVKVDAENKKVYIKCSDSICYEAPIYSLEELIEIGEKYVGE